MVIEPEVSETLEPEAAPSPTRSRPHPVVRLRWWHEVAFVAVFYSVYSAIRNQFGSAAISPDVAFRNAERVIEVERSMGLFIERQVQELFLDWDWFLWSWNVFYGTFHFGVTIFALVWLFRHDAQRYRFWRNSLAATTGLALLGFSLFPLMPPRLLDACPGESLYGACADYGFTDTLREFGGLWSFDSGAMSSVSNQYAAMPSLHFGWATWCALALVPILRSRTARVLLVLYPALTLFAIVVTGNHYWIDALGGAVVLAAGTALGWWVLRLNDRYRLHRLGSATTEDPDRTDQPGCRTDTPARAVAPGPDPGAQPPDR